MASKQVYAQLRSTDDPLEDLIWKHQQTKQSQVRQQQRLHLLLAFVGGLLLGIIGTHVSGPIYTLIVEAGAPAGDGAQSNGTIAAIDVNDIGFIKEPQAGDPVCGNNRHEALEAGCKYDLMASRWYTEECYNADVLEQFMREVDFDWYWEPQHQNLATLDVALAGEYDKLWPLHDFHIMHCLYQWRRLHLAIIEHRHIDDDVYSYEHTFQCTRMMINWLNEWKYGKNTTTLSTSGVSYCIPGNLGV